MLKAGFVGFGRMGITHFSILNGLNNVQVKAICEPSKTMTLILDKYLDVELYNSYQKMFEECDLDFVVVSTPPESHADIMDMAIDKGLHFFVEKPLTISRIDGDRIVEKIKHSDIVHQVGYVNRFCETFSQLKAMLEQDIVGDVKTFSSEMYSATVLKDSSGGWRGEKKSGGGCMYEMASHCVDLAIYLFGAPLGVSGSVVQSIYSSKVDDLVSSTLHYPEGVSGRVVVNWSDASYRKPGNIITVIGTKGKIIASKYHLRVFLVDDNEEYGFRHGWNTKYLTDVAENVEFYVRGNEFTRQLSHFVKCVEHKLDTLSSCFDANITDAVLTSIAHDANLSKMVTLSGDEVSAYDALPKTFFDRLKYLFSPKLLNYKKSA